MKTILISLLIFIMPLHLSAQSNDEQDVKVKQRVRELTDRLDYYLQQMTNGQNPNTVRFQYSSEALVLFVANGEPVISEGKNVELKVEIFSRNRTSTRSLKAYFDYIRNFKPEIKMQLVDGEVFEFIPSEIKKVTDKVFILKYKRYNNFADFNANRYEIVTITQPICMCCDCEQPILRFGNIKVKESARR